MIRNVAMKILIVSTVEFELNGITSVILNYYKNTDLSEIHMDFVVINCPDDTLVADIRANGSKFFVLPRKKSPISYMINLYKLCKANHYDIIHVHGNSATMALEMVPAMLAGILVRIAHSHNTTCIHLKLHKWLYPLFNISYTHALACGENAGRWLFNGKPFVVLKNGIVLDKYRYDEKTRNKYRGKINCENKRVIGHVGLFNEQKNQKFIIEIFEKIIARKDEYQLVLIGEGPLFQEIKELSKSLGIEERVIFLGTTDKVNCYMQAMDIFVLPSLYEGLPLVLVEAQAAGLPCIVSTEVSREADLTGTVQYINLEDQELWIDKIMSIEINANRGSTDNLKKLELCGYDIERSAKTLTDFYQKCLQQKYT